MSELSPHTGGPARPVPGAPATVGGTEADTLGILLDALFGKGSTELAGTALALGGTASVGTLAWSFYKKWSHDNKRNAPGAAQPAYASPERALNRAVLESPDATEPVNPVGDPAVARLLIRALIDACRAGGGFDDRECRRVGDAIRRVNPDPRLAALLDGFLREPVDADALAAEVHSRDQAQDLYRLSCALADPGLPQEREYLNRLADALHIPDAVKEKIEEEARYTRLQRPLAPR